MPPVLSACCYHGNTGRRDECKNYSTTSPNPCLHLSHRHPPPSSWKNCSSWLVTFSSQSQSLNAFALRAYWTSAPADLGALNCCYIILWVAQQICVVLLFLSIRQILDWRPCCVMSKQPLNMCHCCLRGSVNSVTWNMMLWSQLQD